MKAGTLIIAMHDSEDERRLAERTREFLISHGRKNVHLGFHRGDPDCYQVFLEMNADGVDTYCILPLTISEGNQTVWNMPKHLTLPDNSGSFTMIGPHDVATRFSTAMGREPSLGKALGEHLGHVSEEVGIVLACRGSELSFPGKTMEYYAEYLRYLGWRTEVAYCVKGPCTMAEAGRRLASAGCSSVRVVPFYISAEAPSLQSSLNDLALPYSVDLPVSLYDEFLEILDSKVPEDW